MRKPLSMVASVTLLVFASSSARAQLINGNLEDPLVLQGWTLEETVTGMPGTPVNSAQIQDFANEPSGMPGETGLWLRGFAGNLDGLVNEKTNAILSQTVPGVVGESYTFSGWSRWEMNFSGGVTTLDAGSPSGAIASPTQSAFELAFLDGSNAVIGTPMSVDLRTGQMNDNMWRQETLMDTAPAGTASVRVTASATDMVFNTDPSQSGFYDNFSLTAASAPAVETLSNNELNDPLAVPGWTLTEAPAGTDTAAFAAFANNTPGGGQGLWLRPFATVTPEGDATFSQTATAGPGEYAFRAWSKWEENYSGGQAGSPTQTLLEMTFLDASDAVIGSPLTLDLRTEQMNDNTWREHELRAFAPAGTASIQVSAIAIDMFNTTGAQSAFFDDFSLSLVPEPATAALVMCSILGLVGLVRRR